MALSAKARCMKGSSSRTSVVSRVDSSSILLQKRQINSLHVTDMLTHHSSIQSGTTPYIQRNVQQRLSISCKVRRSSRSCAQQWVVSTYLYLTGNRSHCWEECQEIWSKEKRVWALHPHDMAFQGRLLLWVSDLLLLPKLHVLRGGEQRLIICAPDCLTWNFVFPVHAAWEGGNNQ